MILRMAVVFQYLVLESSVNIEMLCGVGGSYDDGGVPGLCPGVFVDIDFF